MQYDLFNGTPPHVASRETSLDAAIEIKDQITNLASMVFDFIKQRTFIGATCDEIEDKLKMSHQTASARVRELALKSVIKDSGARRKTRSGRKAIVWVEV